MKKTLAILLLILIGLVGTAVAADLNLAWDANPDGQGVLGYYLYWQRSDGSGELMQATIDGRLTTAMTIAEGNFIQGVPYTMYLTAFNSAEESGPSNSIEWAREWPGGVPIVPDQPNGFRLNDTSGVSITNIKPVSP